MINRKTQAMQHLINILQTLSEENLKEVQDFAEFILSKRHDPVLNYLLTAKPVKETLSEEEIKNSQEGWQAYLRGECEPWQKIREEVLSGE
jgi:hypothetical protein